MQAIPGSTQPLLLLLLLLSVHAGHGPLVCALLAAAAAAMGRKSRAYAVERGSSLAPITGYRLLEAVRSVKVRMDCVLE
jgi:hypothetical protein